MKDEDYLVHNLLKIAEQLKFINWNLGKLVAVQTGDQLALSNIRKAEIDAKRPKLI